METTRSYTVSFKHSKKSFHPNPDLDFESSKKTVQKLCEDWRALALKQFSKEISDIGGCSGGCGSHRCCTCFAGAQMNFLSAVQRFTVYKQFDAPGPQQSLAACQSWQKEMQNFNSAGYLTGTCSEGTFLAYAKDGEHILRSRGVSYQFQPPGG